MRVAVQAAQLRIKLAPLLAVQAVVVWVRVDLQMAARQLPIQAVVAAVAAVVHQPAAAQAVQELF
jgi:hypothetical protein